MGRRLSPPTWVSLKSYSHGLRTWGLAPPRASDLRGSGGCQALHDLVSEVTCHFHHILVSKSQSLSQAQLTSRGWEFALYLEGSVSKTLWAHFRTIIGLVQTFNFGLQEPIFHSRLRRFVELSSQDTRQWGDSPIWAHHEDGTLRGTGVLGALPMLAF